MNDYISNYEKSIKYSLLPQKDHIINLIHSDPNNSPVFADAIEEQDLHHDNETLEHLRNHSGPFKAEKKNGKIKVRAVRPVYGNLYFNQEDEHVNDILEDLDGLPIHEKIDEILDTHMGGLDRKNSHEEASDYISESRAGRSDTIHEHDNHILSINPRLGYIGLEHKKYVPLDEYEKIKKLTEERLNR